MGAIDMSIVNVAVPYIQASLGVSITEIAWISTGYIIALVIVMPLTSWLSLRFGRKRVYMICVVLFTAASFMCGQSRTLPMLTFFRIIQGFGAGAMQPIQQAILRETFPPEKQAMAMGIFGVAVMIGPAIGPTLGGWITDNYHWPWIFFINIPIGFVALWMIQLWVHDPPYLRAQGRQAGADLPGIALLAIGLATLQTVLEEGQTWDWFSSDLIVWLSIISFVCLVCFLVWESRTPSPAVDFTVLKDPSFATGTVIGGVLGLSLFASMFLLPLFMQELLGYTATQSGLMLMPRALAMILFMPIAGALYNRVGPKVMVGSGLLIAGFGAMMMSRFSLDIGEEGLLVPQVIQGAGFCFVFVALSTAALSGIPRSRMTAATGLYNLIRQLGGSFGTAIFATMLERDQQSNRSVMVKFATPYNSVFQNWMLQLQQLFQSIGSDAHTASMQSLKVIDEMMSQQAAMLAYDRAFFIIGALFFICVPMVLLLRAPSRIGHAPEPVGE